MTVNERLFAGGVVSDFDSAIDSNDRQKAIDILNTLDLDEDAAASTVDSVLTDPSKYGYPRA